MIGAWPRCPATRTSPTLFDALADVSEILGEQGFRVLAYRRAATRIRETGASIAELALAGKAKELPGIGATIEAKIVELTETGEMSALEKRRAEVPDEVSQFLRLPGLGPKTAARIWRELGVTTLDGLREAAEQQRVRALPGARREERGADPRGARQGLRPGAGAARPAGRGCRSSARSSRRSARTRRRSRSPPPAACGGGRETFRDLDVIATATDPAALIAHFVELPWVLEVAAHGDTKATVVTKQGLRLDLRVVPPEDYGSLLQHFTGSKDHNVALREDAQRRGLSVSEYGVTVVETGEVHRFAPRRSSTASSATPRSRPSCARTAASSRPRATAACRRSSRRATSSASSTATPTGRRTGRRSIEEMALEAKRRGYRFLALTDHSHYLRDGRMEAQWEEIEAVNERVKPFKVLRGRRGEHPGGRLGRRGRRAARRARLGRRLAPRRLRQEPDRAHPRRDRPSARRLHRPPHGPEAEPPRREPTSTWSRSSPARSRRGPRSRSTASPTGSTCATSMRGSPARPACSIPINTDAHSIGALSATRELGVAQARRAWLTKDQILNTRPWREIAAARR